MPNIRSKMNGHNIKILWSKCTELHKLCSCLDKEDCAMNGLCLTSSILYQATMKCNETKYKQNNDTKESVKRPKRKVTQSTKYPT